MKILIADDEKLARQRLISLINDLDTEIQVVAEAVNGCEALEKWLATKADVVLLDIRMPEMDGLQVASELAVLASPPVIIFTTAYDEHALQAFDNSAVDYLLKPIRKNRLQSALQKADVFNRAKLQSLQLSELDKQSRSHICVHTYGDLHLISIKDIYYFYADHKYVMLRTVEHEYLIDEPLKELEREFEGLFLRIHRNALVSLEHIEELHKDHEGALQVKFPGLQESLTVSRRHATKVRASFKKYERVN